MLRALRGAKSALSKLLMPPTFSDTRINFNVLFMPAVQKELIAKGTNIHA